MLIRVDRREFTDESTIGLLTVDGRTECFTLEDKVRAVKVKGRTAIPTGIYELVVTFSDRFQRPLPLLLNVPNFRGIRIHPGNTAADTEGCILVGTTRSSNRLGGSRVAFKALFDKIRAALEREKVFVEVAGGSQEDIAAGNRPG